MILRYDPEFIDKLKKVDVKIRKSFKNKILVFSDNPDAPELNNHPLREEWEGYRSIDVTNDWRAVYTEKVESGRITAFFVALGTHRDLYNVRSQ